MKWTIKHISGRVLFVTSDEFIAENRRKMGWIVEEVKMTSREQLEEWAKENGMSLTYGDCDYVYSPTAWAWKAWQASRAAIEIELPEPCSTGDFCIDIPAQAHHEVIEVIENAGLKVKK
ncbi:TPA: hypothetical protein SFI08_002384 [Staphylococcus aureus]|nr:hypothetical protein [Salmonella phage vB_SpuS_NX263]HEG7246585.1 hypothetical protein [Staphylococcus aureus]